MLGGLFGAAVGNWLYDSFARGGHSSREPSQPFGGPAENRGMAPAEPGAGDFSGDAGSGGDFGDSGGDDTGGGEFEGEDTGGDDTGGGGEFEGDDTGGGDFGGGDFGGGGDGGA